MEWKTFSVEAGDEFSKQAPRTSFECQSGAFSNSTQRSPADRSGYDHGMQKDGLTMFRLSCYSC